MPKRVVRVDSFEVESEQKPLKPSHLRGLHRAARQMGKEALAEWSAADSDEDRFYAAPRAAMALYVMEEQESATQVAQQALGLAAQYPDNWNYGNAVHYAHTVLGLVALGRADVSAAIQALHASAAMPGSPQLHSFGPSMLLARELLLLNQHRAVLDYFAQCAVFWSSGQAWLRVWRQKVLRKEIPNFTMHLYR